MENKQEYLSNFKCYYRKVRVAVFGYKIGENSLRIVEILCSVKDQFSKEVAKRVFQEFIFKSRPICDGKVTINGYYGTFHPTVYSVKIKEGDSESYTFKKHCQTQYYHPINCEITLNDNRIVKDGKFVKLPNTKPQVIKIKKL